MFETPLSAIVDIGPIVRVREGLSRTSLVSFIPMSDVSESGRWTVKQVRPLGSVSAGFTAFMDGDVLVAKITPCLENGKGTHAVGLENGIGFGSTEFHVLRAKQENVPRFIFHLTQWKRFRLAAEQRMVGSAGQQRVPRSFFEEFFVANFDNKQQAKIVEVLDALDTAIFETEAMIAKVKAVKQGLLHDLLTRGIDENGELRPSHAEAPHLYLRSPLGWLPESWTSRPFGELCESSAFGPRFPSDAYDQNGPLATLRTTDMDDDGTINLSTMPRASIAPSAFAEHLLQVGDIVISRSGTCGVTGVFVGHEIPVVPGAFLIRFRLRDLQLNRFYRRYFNCSLGRPSLERLAVGGVQKNIKGSDVLRLEVPVPSAAEATRIADRIESVEHDIAVNEKVLKKLTLQKSALMSDLLTGRVRVTPLLAESPKEQEAA